VRRGEGLAHTRRAEGPCGRGSRCK
jgi:hypothetical protein